MIIANAQIRAARAMLNWSQRQLIATAGISLRTLHSIEAGLIVPRLETLKAIKNALEKAGIEFMDEGAIKLRREIFDVEKNESENAIELLTHDFMESYRQGVTELLLCNSIETKWVELTTPETSKKYKESLIRYVVKERCLISHGDKTMFGYPTIYRWMPKEYFREACFVVYGNTLALIVWHPIVRTAIIRNAAIADSYRSQFELIWERAEIAPLAEVAQQHQRQDRPRVWSEEDIIRVRKPEEEHPERAA